MFVVALQNALSRWPGNVSAAAADFQAAALATLKSLLAEEIAASYRDGVVAVIAYIIDSHPQHRFIADCIAFASNLHALQGGLSESDIAKRHNVKRATVSKWVNIVSRDLDLARSRGMKDEDATEAYRQRAHEVHGTAPKAKQSSVKVTTIESLSAKLCRALSSASRAGLTREDRLTLSKSLAPLAKALAPLSKSLAPLAKAMECVAR
ncbi:MAG: hypothetical protein Fur0032_01020 [Terrimicrobiaceae bacterium]